MKTTGRWIVAAMMLASISAYAQTAAPAAPTGTAPTGGDAGKERPRPGGERGAMMEQMSFEKMDADGDGKVTFEEFKAAMEPMMKRRFDQMDENKDGVLTKEELQKARDNMRGGPGGGRMGGGERPARREAGAAATDTTPKPEQK